jgi:hypothetical protein
VRDADGDECVRAGAGAAVVGAGFEGDAGSGVVEVVAGGAGLVQRDDLGVVAGVVEVRAFAQDVFAVEEDAADGWIGGGEGSGAASEL